MRSATRRLSLLVFILVASMLLASEGCSALDALGPKPAQPDPCSHPDTIQLVRDSITGAISGHGTVHACVIR